RDAGDETGFQDLAEIASGETGADGRASGGGGNGERKRTGREGKDGAEQDRRSDLQDRPADRVVLEEVSNAREEVADAAENIREQVEAVRIGEGERVVADIGIAVPALRIERIRDCRIGAGEARKQRVVDAAVQMHEAANRELLLAGEAPRGLAGDAA